MKELTQQEFWNEFTENVEMACAFPGAHQRIVSFLEKYGCPNIKGFSESIEALRNIFVSNEDYELCIHLDAPFKLRATDGELVKFKKDLEIATTNNDNCDICFEVLEANGMLAFECGYPYVLGTKIKGTRFVTVLLDHFTLKGDINKCSFLHLMKDELLKEISRKAA
jgi:hypothetical protein